MNAKQVSYDGDDWGSSDEDSDEEPPVPSLPIQKNTSGTSQRQPQPLHVETRTASTSSQDARNNQPPIVRPADIYKRMGEEQEKERQKGEAPAVTESPIEDKKLDSQAALKGVTFNDAPHLGQSQLSSQSTPTGTTQSTPGAPSQLPEIKRTSAFGSEFMTTSNEPDKNETTGEVGLQHNPSLGFRSVVHQAFDVPETPSTATGSIKRSDSESTSVISPIIRTNTSGTFEGRVPHSEQTPTIEEEPPDPRRSTDENTPTGTAPDVPGFKPGHRRSMTPPTSGAAPARQPIVSSNSYAAQSEWGDVNDPALRDQTSGPSDHSQTPTADTLASLPHPEDDSYGVGDPQKRSSIAPLALGPTKSSQNLHNTPTISVPENLSASSSETASPNERLRKEIIQSLSPRSSVEPEGETGSSNDAGAPKEGHDPFLKGSPIANEYGSHWGENVDSALKNSVRPLSTAQPLSLSDTPLNANTEDNASPVHQLKKRFSWEESSSEDGNQPTQPAESAHDTNRLSLALQSPVSPTGESSALFATTNTDLQALANVDEHEPPISSNSIDESPPQLKGIEPQSSLPSSPPLEITAQRDGDAASPPASRDVAKTDALDERPISSPTFGQDPNLLGFHDILSMKSPDEKIKAFEETREKVAAIDTGLATWIRQVSNSNSEHTSLVEYNGRLPPDSILLHKHPPSRNKFPKLSSLGNISLQTSHDNSAPSPNHARSPSTIQLGTMVNSQQMQAKGKDLLHSAGVLGGKAGGAAKGFFSKGRSRFRQSGPGDKVDS